MPYARVTRASRARVDIRDVDPEAIFTSISPTTPSCQPMIEK
jgi:hypothetical protein